MENTSKLIHSLPLESSQAAVGNRPDWLSVNFWWVHHKEGSPTKRHLAIVVEGYRGPCMLGLPNIYTDDDNSTLMPMLVNEVGAAQVFKPRSRELEEDCIGRAEYHFHSKAYQKGHLLDKEIRNLDNTMQGLKEMSLNGCDIQMSFGRVDADGNQIGRRYNHDLLSDSEYIEKRMKKFFCKSRNALQIN